MTNNFLSVISNEFNEKATNDCIRNQLPEQGMKGRKKTDDGGCVCRDRYALFSRVEEHVHFRHNIKRTFR